MSKTREVRPFGARDKFGYLFGDLANDFSFIFASTYVMVFYTKVMGISAAMVGTMESNHILEVAGGISEVAGNTKTTIEQVTQAIDSVAQGAVKQAESTQEANTEVEHL